MYMFVFCLLFIYLSIYWGSTGIMFPYSILRSSKLAIKFTVYRTQVAILAKNTFKSALTGRAYVLEGRGPF